MKTYTYVRRKQRLAVEYVKNIVIVAFLFFNWFIAANKF